MFNWKQDKERKNRVIISAGQVCQFFDAFGIYDDFLE